MLDVLRKGPLNSEELTETVKVLRQGTGLPDTIEELLESLVRLIVFNDGVLPELREGARKAVTNILEHLPPTVAS